VTLRIGHDNPLESTAARTRSRASRTAASGRPTIVNPGKPLETWTSTETEHPTAPLNIAEFTSANMPKNGLVSAEQRDEFLHEPLAPERWSFNFEYLCRLCDLSLGYL
jgi:hypothetical protein